MLRTTHKADSYEAWVRKDGRISCRGAVYNSPSAAGKAAIGRWVDGWLFWRFKDNNGDWVRLDELRKASRGERDRKRVAKGRGRAAVLAPYVNKRFKIRMDYKGRTINACVRSDGTINYAGEIYNSPSIAGARARGKRALNGWKAWKFKNSKGEWVYLDELRKGHV